MRKAFVKKENLHICTFTYSRIEKLNILRFAIQINAGFELAAVDAALHAEQEGGQQGEVAYHGHQQGYRQQDAQGHGAAKGGCGEDAEAEKQDGGDVYHADAGFADGIGYDA